MVFNRWSAPLSHTTLSCVVSDPGAQDKTCVSDCSWKSTKKVTDHPVWGSLAACFMLCTRTHTHHRTHAHTHTPTHRSLLKHKRAHVKTWDTQVRHTCMHARRHNSVETNDAHLVNRINYNCMMGNFIVPARVSLMLLDFSFLFFFFLTRFYFPQLRNNSSMFFCFSKPACEYVFCNQYECSVNTELAWENYFLLRMFLICFLSLLIVL